MADEQQTILKETQVEQNEIKARMLKVQNEFAFALNQWLGYNVDEAQDIAEVLVKVSMEAKNLINKAFCRNHSKI